MKRISFNKHQAELLEKAIRYAVSDLQYERHQALAHGCSAGCYDKEIEEFKKLKQYINDESIQSRQTSD